MTEISDFVLTVHVPVHQMSVSIAPEIDDCEWIISATLLCQMIPYGLLHIRTLTILHNNQKLDSRTSYKELRHNGCSVFPDEFTIFIYI